MPKTQRRLVSAGAVWTLALLTLTLFAAPATAQTHDEGRFFVRGYGGVTFASAGTSEGTVAGGLAGGGIGVDLTRHLAVIGDGGYLANIATQEGDAAANRAAALVTFVNGPNANVTVAVRALYVMGGARLTFGDHLRWFVEGLGGMARSTFTLQVSSADGTVVTDATNIFKNVIGNNASRSPVGAAGGGVDLRLTRRVAAEVGYRYLRLFGDAKANVHQGFGGVLIRF